MDTTTLRKELEEGEAKALGLSMADYYRLKQGTLAEIDRLSKAPIVETARGEASRLSQVISTRNCRIGKRSNGKK